MTKVEFEKYIENISVFERMKENLYTLKIEWETDLNKIDFSVLASGFKVPTTPKMRYIIEWVPTERFPKDSEMFVDGDIERMIELFKLIENGTKIIPPMFFKAINYIDGVPGYDVEYDNQPSRIRIDDGHHRLRFARALNLQEIPVLSIEIPYKRSYSKKNWDIKCTGEKVEFTHKTTGEVQTIPVEAYNFQLRKSGDYFCSINVFF